MVPRVQLNNGQKMPLLGLGCYQANDGKDISVAVETALLAGYRHIDSAYLPERRWRRPRHQGGLGLRQDGEE